MAKIYTRKEVQKRRMRFQIAAGMFDFIAIIAGIIVIIACVVLLSTLIKWTIGDVAQSFKVFIQIFNDALIIPE